ncbi:MAG: HAMP domain-containing sensor histidine kinase [Campylobacterota bacterium]|nr:HAMP domain-containing sensor histidine kinase [Campylobacterota bacterium]
MIKSILKKINLKVKYLLVFMMLSFIVYILVDYINNKNKIEYLKQTTETYLHAYSTIYEQYSELSSIMASGIIENADLINKLKIANNSDIKTKNKIKKELYHFLFDRFETLKLKKIRNINFILKDRTILLKMRKYKEEYKTINKSRISIDQVLNTKSNFYGYETGKAGSGFRYVYPVLDNGEILGVIDMTFGPEAITSGIMKQYYVLSNFFIKGDRFEKDFIDSTMNYRDSHHKGYQFDIKVLEVLKKISRDDMANLVPQKSTTNKIYNSAIKNKPNSIYDEKIKMIFTIIPILNNKTKEQEAFLTVRSEDKSLAYMSINSMIIMVLLMSLIGVILYILYLQHIKNKEDNINFYKKREQDKKILEQAKLAQMGEMIGNIAHQWRQPLNSISTVASSVNINIEYDMLNIEELSTQMDIILKNVNYLSDTIDTFRDFIKDEESTPKEIILQENISETLKIVSASLDNNFITIINNINNKEDITLKIIPGALSQVLMNIINNSKDAIVINEIENSFIKIDAEIKEKNIIITIEDNAGGVPNNIKNKIFNPYFTTKHQSQGTGLGLYMSKKIVEEHLNGKLYLKNTEDGAKFFINIPIRIES